MLKELYKLVARKEVIIAIIVLVVLYVLATYNESKVVALDSMQDGTISNDLKPSSIDAQPIVAETASAPASLAGYTAKAVNAPSDLLPADHNSEWSKLNPTANVNGAPDLLQSGYHIGTVSQVMRNANLQLRADPVIPRAENISPWMNSTIEPDLGRVPLEVGYGPR
jgi:hypothetical protein